MLVVRGCLAAPGVGRSPRAAPTRAGRRRATLLAAPARLAAFAWPRACYSETPLRQKTKSPAGDSRGAHDMTLLDHSRAQERDAVAKTRSTTDSDTVVVRAPAGSLGVFIARDASHRVTGVRSGSPLAGEVAVGDRLVSISTPGRALFTCGPTATGLDVIDELRAGAGSDGRVLTFARRVSPFAVCCEPSRIDPVSRLSMAMGCPCFIVAVILFIMNEIFYHSPGGAVISIFLFMLSAAGCVAGCCLSAICPATPPGEDDVAAQASLERDGGLEPGLPPDLRWGRSSRIFSHSARAPP